jgi:type IV secretion system protein VirB10
MDLTHASPEGVDAAALGPPARFDAEPVRRKSRRWIVVVSLLFLTIAGAVGLGLWQGRAYLKSVAAEREAKQKRDQEEASQARPKKVFELDTPAELPELPEQFGKAKDSLPAPIPVIRSPEPLAGMSQQVSRPDTALKGEPARPSMFVAIAPPAPATSETMTTSPTSLAGPAAPPAAGGSPSALDALLRPQNAAAGGATRSRSVQEQARRAAPAAVTNTDQAMAAHLGNRSFLIPRGAVIPCTLLTQIDSTVRGPASCVVSQNIYSDDGQVLLIERGSSIAGDYGATALKTGDRRMAIVWRRIRTPNGVVIDVDSPATDSVGTVGVDGHVDNHWFERIGAALMLSLADDAIQVQVARQGAQAAGASGATQPYQATTGTTKSIAERVLESTINIPPTITKNRGERLLVFLNRDLWFDQVYQVPAR